MAALVDTSILIDHLRQKAEARDLLKAELDRGEPLFGSVLSKAEVLAGSRPDEEAATSRLLAALVWIDVTETIAERAGALAASHRRSHPGVGLVDHLIAATRDLLDVPLWTLNVRHFPMIEGLARPY